MSDERKTVKRQLTQDMILDPHKRVRELSDIGSSVQVDKTFSVKRYFRSGSEMERMARVYYGEGQLDKAFVLYNKFVTLFLEKLPKQYPDYNKPEYKTERARIKKLVKEAFPRAEQLKQQLLQQFESEKDALENKLSAEAEKRHQEEEKRRVVEQREREVKERKMREEEEKKAREEAERVAAFLATPEGQRNQQTTDQPSNIPRSHENEVVNQQDSVRDGSSTGDWTVNATTTTSSSDDQVSPPVGTLTLQESPEDVSRPTADLTQGRSLTATNAQLAQVLPPVYQDPSAPSGGENMTPQQTPTTPLGGNLVPPPSPRTYDSIFSGPAMLPQATPPPQTAPPVYSENPPPANPYYHSSGGQGTQIPPQQGNQFQPPAGYAPQYHMGYYPTGQYQQQTPPPGGPYTTQYSTASSSSWGSVELPAPSYHMTPLATPPTSTIVEEQEEESELSEIPTFDRTKKPAYSALSTSIGGGYRMVSVPDSLSRKFEAAASDNTRKNIETCGILAGKLARNQLHITHVILPKQRGGPDSCETLSEEELFDIQDQHDLITLGWIHTHPSQTAFMSSVDLHTHCSYQIMLDEAIAIVCAPRYSQVGVYMLTEPYGLDYITHCESEGFHTHPKEPPLYEDCSHVIFSSSPVEIVDLR